MSDPNYDREQYTAWRDQDEYQRDCAIYDADEREAKFARENPEEYAAYLQSVEDSVRRFRERIEADAQQGSE